MRAIATLIAAARKEFPNTMLLDGNVYTQGRVESASKYVPEMKANGAQIVVAMSHGGLGSSTCSPPMENGSCYLSKVAGIDAMLIATWRPIRRSRRQSRRNTRQPSTM